ncbi:MAG: hypothetical protein DMF99_27270 [Acidobacteria bacterium]|nr:MAG: hypothetical protein DMG03_25395 [Acidobacteriota bacterium]PYR05861.1 MAG: hypothetical protein DMF99_27270 [Acidobacteriota bacterium]
MGMPGATPTTPVVLLIAPIVPATCVPWPLPSLKLPPVEQFLPPAMLRSACGPLPVSMTATAKLHEFDAKCELRSASIRLTPVGSVWAAACTGRSSERNATDGSRRISSRRASGIAAA